MDHEDQTDPPMPIGDMADHIAEARLRAQRMLAGESHLGAIDDARQALVRARDGVLLIWLMWLVLDGFGVRAEAGGILVAVGGGLSVLAGLVAGVATRHQLLYYESELQRERHEIETEPRQEREEVRTMYAAKGLRPPLLDQVVDTLCADDDRLLKVMMEEELGLFVHNLNHPVLVGVWHGGGALLGSMALAVPVCFMDAAGVRLWMLAAGGALLAGLTAISGWRRGKVVPAITGWLIVGGVTGGLVYYLSRLLSGQG